MPKKAIILIGYIINKPTKILEIKGNNEIILVVCEFLISLKPDTKSEIFQRPK